MALTLQCKVDGCSFIAANDDKDFVLAEFASHQRNHDTAPLPPSRPESRAPKMDRPKVGAGCTEETWNTFLVRWRNYKRTLCISETAKTGELFACCDTEIGDDLIKQDSSLLEGTEDALLCAIKKLAVIPVALCVRRSELLQLRQDHGETARLYYARVKGKADTCNFQVKCNQNGCPGGSVDYTEEMIKTIITTGLSDVDIHREVLGWHELDSKTAIETVAYIETKEMARNALLSASANNSLSSYSKQKKNPADTNKENKVGKCPKCKKEFHLFKFFKRSKQWNDKPFPTCFDCRPQKKSSKSDEDGQDDSQTNSIFSSLGALSSAVNTASSSNYALHNLIFDTELGWMVAPRQRHPSIRLRALTKEEDYQGHGVFPKIAPFHVDVITDSGAQCCLWGQKQFLRVGFKMTDLLKVDHQVNAANKAPIKIVGAILLRLQGKGHDGAAYECAVMVFISPDAEHFFLSKEAMQQLQIIPENFPQVGAASKDCSVSSVTKGEAPPDSTVCNCLKKELPPKKLERLPMAPTPENNAKFKEFLLNRYASSTFNQCPHQTLPNMRGPPMKIHVDPEAKPVAHIKPVPIPLHYYDQVISDIKRDIAMGVLEYAPFNEPVTWCHRMVVVPKGDTTPRRTVDMSALNKSCKREPHGSKSPFEMARAVPRNTWKSVHDAWNGYHSIPICEEDRHLTTFQSPIGRLRYAKAPQGFLSSGDAYNKRFDLVLTDFQDKERCVDDTIYWDHDTELEAHWWRTLDFLDTVGNSGVVLNPNKFQFAQKTVQFAGFEITETSVKPLSKYINAIQNFPTPSNVTDVRAWFGLVNQVAHYAQLRELVEPMRPMLKKNAKFEWTDSLNVAFEESKSKIIEAIKEGVEIFDKGRLTCLSTDWCKFGIGYYLKQKHCDCESDSPDCCPDGWRITLAGSRHTTKHEMNYAPVEGEMLSAAWGLKQTRYFTMGCTNLVVITDHKPLLKLLGDRTFDEIENMRLFRLKLRTLPWRFRIQHCPGKEHYVADATSRNPSATDSDDEIDLEDDMLEVALLSTLRSGIAKIRAVTWDLVREEMKADENMKLLLDLVTKGFPEKRQDMPPNLKEYWGYNSIYVLDGVILCNERVLIPPKLRNEILMNLHAAHHGVLSMTHHSQNIITWPGITADIQRTRNMCRGCNENAPSQARMPADVPTVPSMPFESVCSDFFELEGYRYLVTVDRFSGWGDVQRSKSGTSTSGSRGLTAALRQLFATFGVPFELSSDGGPEYIADETTDFLRRWGVHHRISSVAHPESNGRAELGVKSMKRLLRDNIGTDGNLNTDEFLRAILAHRNTPDPISKKSSAEILFGHRLRDTMPVFRHMQTIFENQEILPMWRDAWSLKEMALRTRAVKTAEKLDQHARQLPPLRHGDAVFVQNQVGNHPKKWDRTGVIVECRPHNQYTVKIDATGRLSLRNRKYLRKFIPSEKDVLLGFRPYCPPEPSTDPVLKETFVSPGSPMFDAEPSSASPPTVLLDSNLDDAKKSPMEVTIPNNQSENQKVTPMEDALPSNRVTEPIRRSTRERKPTKMYDAHTGTYVAIDNQS